MENSAEERLLAPEETEVSGNLTRTFWTESKLIWRVAFPGIIARVTSFGMVVVTQLFLGHVSELDLAAFALDQSILMLFVNGILIGMSSATETLCGQAYGARHYAMMGIYLQRSWIVDGVVATIMLPLFIFSAQIFKLLGQQQEIADVSGYISLWFIPLLYSFVFSSTIQMYLQSQMKNQIVGWVSAISFAIHVILSWLFVSVFDWGIDGAMGAMSISNCVMIIGEFVYIFGGWCPETWKGFTLGAFSDIWPVVKLSISSGVMLCLELWYSSILVLVAGYMKDATTAISAFSICFNISAWTLMLFLGFLGASSVRVSNELGRGNSKGAKFSISVILSISAVIGVALWILCLIFGRKISYLFTSDEDVAEAVSSVSVFLAFSVLLNSIQPVLSGVAVGAGMQGMVAYVNLGCYYCVGIPIGLLLAYVANFGVKGLWIGLLSGVVMQTLALSIIVWRTDWDQQVNKALERLDRWSLNRSDEFKREENVKASINSNS